MFVQTPTEADHEAAAEGTIAQIVETADARLKAADATRAADVPMDQTETKIAIIKAVEAAAKAAEEIKDLEGITWKQGQTQIFMETPYRNMQLLETLLKSCRPETRLCVACDLTQTTETVISATIGQWQKLQLPALNKRPAVFLIYGS